MPIINPYYPYPQEDEGFPWIGNMNRSNYAWLKTGMTRTEILDYFGLNYLSDDNLERIARGDWPIGGTTPNPNLPPTTTSGGIAVPQKMTWDTDYTLSGAPSWWKGMMPSQWTPESEFAAMANAMIPYLSPEDQRQLGSSLSRLFPDAFGSYSAEKTEFGLPPQTISPQNKFYFTSQQRGSDMLNALSKMQQASGKSESDMGPGYQYLRQLAQTLVDYGGRSKDARSMSRREQMMYYGAIDPLLAETQGEQLGAYGEIARAVTQPFFSAGNLVNVSKGENGEWIFGKANTKWF